MDFSQDFYKTLEEVITAMLPLKQLEELTNIVLEKYLFEKVWVVLIPSIPGRYNGDKLKEMGITKVKHIMQKHNTLINPILTYQSTSLGIVDSKLV
jgi:hypothetical protein